MSRGTMKAANQIASFKWTARDTLHRTKQEMEDYLKYIGAGVVTIGAVSTALLLKATPQAIEPLVDLNKQSIVIPGPERAHKSCLLGSQTHEDSLTDVTTLHEAFKRGARLSDNGRCIGWRPDPQKPYSWLSYNDVSIYLIFCFCAKFILLAAFLSFCLLLSIQIFGGKIFKKKKNSKNFQNLI
ncbi:ACSL [Acanthosepion pharaonis]|uniref:ACSL n=1 Tax=Acanthosepion pharaonis TaxID=158019 RepID=A0A812C8P0_ACAPH|nr:ACSL [Sepia pharaonis]